MITINNQTYEEFFPKVGDVVPEGCMWCNKDDSRWRGFPLGLFSSSHVNNGNYFRFARPLPPPASRTEERVPESTGPICQICGEPYEICASGRDNCVPKEPAPSPAQSTAEALVERSFRELFEAMVRYDADVDDSPTREHYEMMRRASAAMYSLEQAKPTQPDAAQGTETLTPSVEASPRIPRHLLHSKQAYRWDKPQTICFAADVEKLERENTGLTTELRKARDAAQEAEAARCYDAIRKQLFLILEPFEEAWDQIDGAGADSGDLLDATLAEVSQAGSFLSEEISSLELERDQAQQDLSAATAEVAQMRETIDRLTGALKSVENGLTIADYEEVLQSHRKNVRALDVAMHGEEGAAKQASLCDLIGPARDIRAQAAKDAATIAGLREGYQKILKLTESRTYPAIGMEAVQIAKTKAEGGE